MKRGLIVVDVQRDFCEGGALAVTGGNFVGERIGKFLDHHADFYDYVAFTKDWHNEPPDTNGGHFSDTPDYVDSWPVHCVANTLGACFHGAISPKHYEGFGNVFYKGQGRPDYSGFQGRNLWNHDLNEELKMRGIRDLEILGIAGDHCVRMTALDALECGFNVRILTDMVASVGGREATMQVANEIAEKG